jgi:hypothetical protein
MIYISIKIRQFINSIPRLNELLAVKSTCRKVKYSGVSVAQFTRGIQDKIFDDKKIILTIKI